MPGPTGEWRAFYEAVDKRRDELERTGIDLDVRPSMRVGWCPTATTVELIAPVEVRGEAEVRALATLARRLLKREVVIAQEWPDYQYGRDAWLAESGLRTCTERNLA